MHASEPLRPWNNDADDERGRLSFSQGIRITARLINCSGGTLNVQLLGTLATMRAPAELTHARHVCLRAATCDDHLRSHRAATVECDRLTLLVLPTTALDRGVKPAS